MKLIVEQPAPRSRADHAPLLPYVWQILLSDAARPLRVMCTGGIAALAQLALLDALTDHAWNPTLADAVSIALGAQVNFWLSYVFTWHDRRPRRWAAIPLLRRWALYQAASATAAVLNLAVFEATRHALPIGVAALTGTVVAAGLSFLFNDRYVFRRERTQKSRAHLAIVDDPAGTTPESGHSGGYTGGDGENTRRENRL
jgi:putative flippase GtrA